MAWDEWCRETEVWAKGEFPTALEENPTSHPNTPTAKTPTRVVVIKDESGAYIGMPQPGYEFVDPPPVLPRTAIAKKGAIKSLSSLVDVTVDAFKKGDGIP